MSQLELFENLISQLVLQQLRERLQSIRAMYGFNQLLNFFFVQTLFYLGAEPLKLFRFCVRDSVDQ
ncbi:MAG: hypothetical protein RM368_36895 [Nostoc sp. DedSLP03]|uniref:hypothetical protein n=1 Tax=Nostoc sp. DedSLP03 TaxID=3075400 RepID=UPI002AD46879|nr:MULTISPECIES: hypothetical protein [unclassified Nostoc]MDZ7970445.1 hypothetical protein [Nostoc sp. DedSLP03]MDZ8212573.1 hypothetical protein [Nostoc sp. ChiSLP03a]